MDQGHAPLTFAVAFIDFSYTHTHTIHECTYKNIISVVIGQIYIFLPRAKRDDDNNILLNSIRTDIGRHDNNKHTHTPI